MSEPGTCSIQRHSLLPFLQDVLLRDLTPADWLHCASFLQGLLARAPLKDGSGDVTGWRAERWILGCLATELAQMAHELGETADPVPTAFGKDPVSKARALVAELEAIADATHHHDERRLADAYMREARRDAADADRTGEVVAAVDDLADVFG